jgi:hypothetical protein
LFLYSKDPATGLHSKPREFNSHAPYFLISILILSSHLHICPPSGLFPPGLPIKCCAHFSPL